MRTIPHITHGVAGPVAMLLLACPVFWCITEGATAQDGSIVLRDAAYVQGPKILLGEVAQLDAAAPRELAGLEITEAAQPGATKRIARSLVALRLQTLDASFSKTSLKGPDAILATTASREISPEEIAHSLYSHIVGNMPWQEEDAEITIPAMRDAVTIADRNYDIVWRASPQYEYVGSGSFRGSVMVDGQEKHSFLCRAHVDAYTDVIVAARDIPRGRPVQLADMETKKQAVSHMPRGAIQDINDAVTLITRKTLFQGQPLTRYALDQPRLIRRNQMVQVQMKSGTLWVQSQARALRDGRPGDVIELSNPSNKQQFQGLVLMDGQVLVQ